MRDQVLRVLELHRYSPSPFRCSCGESVGDELREHVADKIVEVFA